jgi:hypothetical protein
LKAKGINTDFNKKTCHHLEFGKRIAQKKGLQTKPNNNEDSHKQRRKTESQSVVSLYYFCNPTENISLFTLFQTINLGIDTTSGFQRTFSTASICCFGYGENLWGGNGRLGRWKGDWRCGFWVWRERERGLELVVRGGGGKARTGGVDFGYGERKRERGLEEEEFERERELKKMKRERENFFF